MKKRITETFPFLLPLRRAQSKLFFYTKMRFDNNTYADKITSDFLAYKIYEAKAMLINDSTGQNIEYQYNKIHNVKLAAACLNGLLISPNQTFSFWNSVRNADKTIPYKSGLTVVNGRLKAEYGGGLCLLSTILFKTFLNSPLKITERHSHLCRAFPENKDAKIIGTDAAVYEGFKDLKAFNDTENTYQLKIDVGEEYLKICLLSDKSFKFCYELKNGNVEYRREGSELFEYAPVVRTTFYKNMPINEEILYINKVRIDYDIEAAGNKGTAQFSANYASNN